MSLSGFLALTCGTLAKAGAVCGVVLPSALEEIGFTYQSCVKLRELIVKEGKLGCLIRLNLAGASTV